MDQGMKTASKQVCTLLISIVSTLRVTVEMKFGSLQARLAVKVNSHLCFTVE